MFDLETLLAMLFFAAVMYTLAACVIVAYHAWKHEKKYVRVAAYWLVALWALQLLGRMMQ